MDARQRRLKQAEERQRNGLAMVASGLHRVTPEQCFIVGRWFRAWLAPTNLIRIGGQCKSCWQYDNREIQLPTVDWGQTAQCSRCGVLTIGTAWRKAKQLRARRRQEWRRHAVFGLLWQRGLAAVASTSGRAASSV